MPGLAYVAALRVYEPVEALGPQFSEWERHRGSPAADPALAPALEREAALRRLITVPPPVAPDARDDGLLLIEIDGRQLGAPTQVALRCWTAMEDLRDHTPDPLLDAYFPRAVLDQEERNYATWRASNPTVVPHIRSKAWTVPLSWFVPFSPTEREEIHELSGTRLRYRTEMTEARRRVARSLVVLRRTLSGDPLVDAVIDIGRWLECFHPTSHVELDYCGLSALRLPGEPEPDNSAGDVQEALAALAASDMQEAVQRYGRLVNRWRCYAEYAHFS